MDTPIPDAPPDWPSLARMNLLWSVSLAVESRPRMHRRLRQFLELPSNVRITKNLMMERMTWGEYFELTVAYADRLVAQGRGRMNADT